jgi:hypothetical protein
MFFISAWGIPGAFSKHRVAAGRLFRHRLHHVPVFTNPSIFNSKKFRDCDPWIALISLQMDVQSDNISISDSFMNGDSQAGMLLEHPFNELDKAVRPVFGYRQIMLGVGKSDVSASRFGRLFLVYGEFVERRYQLIVSFFYGLRCQNYLQTARFERDERLPLGRRVDVGLKRVMR